MNTALIEQQLGIPGKGKYGPWFIARELLRQTWAHKPAVIRDTTFDLRELPFYKSAYDLAWKRDLEPYMIGRTCHHFDKNWSYGGACRGSNMGIGDPVHLNHGDDDTFIRPGLPGIYRVSYQISNHADFNGFGFPDIIDQAQNQEWVTNDILVYAIDRDYDVTIHEAWVWTDYTKVLDKWAEKIWNARQALKGVDKDAYDKMKDIHRVGVGSFATHKEKHEGFDLIHPNWWADAVGKARVNILCNILKTGAPVLIENDGLFYMTRDENWRTAVPELNLTSGKLGAYKHEGSFVLTEQLYEQARGLSAGKLAELFKQAGGESDG